MKDSRPPHLPLADLESILSDISDVLAPIEGAIGASELDMRVVQCRTAIAACRRYHFSAPLLRALSAKVLEVETDALVLRRTVRVFVHGKPSGKGKSRTKRVRRDDRRRRGAEH